VLKEADLITEKKRGKNRFYSLNREKSLELIEFLEQMYDYKLSSLKEYLENKDKQRKKKSSY
jgi:DNA-binding transcriptional ArsR family regulator